MTPAADGTQAVAIAPSAVSNARFHVMPCAMSNALIGEVDAEFESTAGRVRSAGLDGIEVVASYGYPIAQFPNPCINIRPDCYGGTLDNRLRFAREVLSDVRCGAGPDLAIGMRLSGAEQDHHGLEDFECLGSVKLLASDGVLDYLNVTAGTSAGLADSVHVVPPMAIETAYTAPPLAATEEEVDIPVFMAGRINQPQIAEDLLASGHADMCGMTRVLIADPRMPAKARNGDVDYVRACVACNQACIGHMLNGYLT